MNFFVSNGRTPVFMPGAFLPFRLMLHSRRFMLRTGGSGFIFVFMLHTCGRIVFPRVFMVLPLVRSMKMVVFMLLPLVRNMKSSFFMVLPQVRSMKMVVFILLPLVRSMKSSFFTVLSMDGSMNPSVFTELPVGRTIFPFSSPIWPESYSEKFPFTQGSPAPRKGDMPSPAKKQAVSLFG
jgi:hypothetical protein